jgi:hypothetical protein
MLAKGISEPLFSESATLVHPSCYAAWCSEVWMKPRIGLSLSFHFCIRSNDILLPRNFLLTSRCRHGTTEWVPGKPEEPAHDTILRNFGHSTYFQKLKGKTYNAQYFLKDENDMTMLELICPVALSKFRYSWHSLSAMHIHLAASRTSYPWRVVYVLMPWLEGWDMLKKGLNEYNDTKIST